MSTQYIYILYRHNIIKILFFSVYKVLSIRDVFRISVVMIVNNDLSLLLSFKKLTNTIPRSKLKNDLPVTRVAKCHRTTFLNNIFNSKQKKSHYLKPNMSSKRLEKISSIQTQRNIREDKTNALSKTSFEKYYCKRMRI